MLVYDSNNTLDSATSYDKWAIQTIKLSLCSEGLAKSKYKSWKS